MCVCVFACFSALLLLQRLQPAGPCGTHLTGEQSGTRAARGGTLRAPLALEIRQAGGQKNVGSRQKGRAAQQTQGEEKKQSRRYFISSKEGTYTHTHTPLLLVYNIFLAVACFPPPRVFSFFILLFCFELKLRMWAGLPPPTQKHTHAQFVTSSLQHMSRAFYLAETACVLSQRYESPACTGRQRDR